jgi:hypothetical protein
MVSVAMSLEPGDVIITGTPGGVEAARKPPVFMQSGDVFEVEIEGMGVLSNPVQDGQSDGPKLSLTRPKPVASAASQTHGPRDKKGHSNIQKKAILYKTS